MAESLAPSPDLPIGLILAGGEARRLGGGDKTLRALAGRPLLDRVVAQLRPQCRAVLLNANGAAARFAGYGLAVVPDHPQDREAGPLAGVLAGLDWAAHEDPACPLVLTVTGDAPFLPGDLTSRLAAARSGAGAAIAVARSGGRTHPLIALWPVALRDPLRRVLREQARGRVQDIVSSFGVTVAAWPDRLIDPFFNVNTPDDLAIAARWAQQSAA